MRANSAVATQSNLSVHFLDVGQGDSILIETPEDQQILIDGGANVSVLGELAKQLGFFDRTIDVLVATHEDTDHIGGLIDVLERYEVKIILISGNQNDTALATLWRERAAQEGAEVIEVQAGQVLDFGSTEMSVLFPDRDSTEYEANTASIITHFKYGDAEFMLTGDSPKSIEEYLVERYGSSLESDVLKLGHHGSKTSTSQEFLNAVDPDFVVVSAGCDNRYGHPHEEVMERVAQLEIFSTCEDGTVSFASDGQQVWLKK